MTVIAWDGKVLAADKLALDGGGIRRITTKIQRYPGALLAITGNWDIGAELRAWWIAGAHPQEFPESARKEDATLIVIQEDTILTYCTGPYPLRHEQQVCAFGSGRDFAEAAMYLGHDAVRAVEVASALQSDCGGGIDILALETERD